MLNKKKIEMMKELPKKWAPFLNSQPETGMGFWVVTVKTNSGMVYERVVIDSGFVTALHGYDVIPFDPSDISEIKVTHDKWDFNAKTKST